MLATLGRIKKTVFMPLCDTFLFLFKLGQNGKRKKKRFKKAALRFSEGIKMPERNQMKTTSQKGIHTTLITLMILMSRIKKSSQ